jgi:hypothetical protein
MSARLPLQNVAEIFHVVGVEFTLVGVGI